MKKNVSTISHQCLNFFLPPALCSDSELPSLWWLCSCLGNKLPSRMETRLKCYCCSCEYYSLCNTALCDFFFFSCIWFWSKMSTDLCTECQNTTYHSVKERHSLKSTASKLIIFGYLCIVDLQDKCYNVKIMTSIPYINKARVKSKGLV